MMLNSPCQGCEQRKLLCHDSCTSYKEFKYTKEQIRIKREGFLKERSIEAESTYRQWKSRKH